MKTFTEQQQTAYLSACYEAEECANTRYAQWLPAGNRLLSVIVTANIGLE